MGTILVFKDADFSSNSTGLSMVDISASIQVHKGYVRGVLVGSSVYDYRCGTIEQFDIQPYIEQGYTKIAVRPKEGISWSCLISSVQGSDLGTNPVCNSNNSKSLYQGETTFPLTVWHDGYSEVTLESFRYLQVGLKKETVFSSNTYNLDSLLTIELS